MNNCSECTNKANWKCTSCNILLCSMHKRTHNDDEQEHSIIKFKLKVSEELKQKALDSVSAKIRLIDQFSNQVIKSSKIIVEQVNVLSKALLSKLEEQRKKYLQNLSLLDIELIEDQLSMIEKQVKAVLVYEKCESSGGQRWYEQEILKESSSASNRREEFRSLGYDLIQEVLRSTQICLEMSNTYAGEVGTIKGANFIYHGEIENGLKHGIGDCNYYNDGVYNGVYQNGLKEGRGVYKCASGEVYDGEWKAGYYEGRGIYKSTLGDVYDGEWKNDKREGKGVYRSVNGDVYDGEYKNDKREGRGVYKYAGGKVYDGEWKADLQEGRRT